MLVSRAVSENSIPGIAKTVENYIMVNLQNIVIGNKGMKSNNSLFKTLKLVSGRLSLKEGEYATISEASFPSGGTATGHKTGKQTPDEEIKRLEQEIEKLKQLADRAETEKEKLAHQKTMDQKREEQKELERLRDIRDKLKDKKEEKAKAKKDKQEEEKKLAKAAKAEVKASDMKSISLEPTFMEITKTNRDGTTEKQFLGIKVIPMRVKSDVKLSHLLLYDTKMDVLKAGVVAFGRFVTRIAYRIFDKWTRYLRLLGGLAPSGDPRRDIIMGRTGMGKESETFIVLSKQEDVDETFLDNVNKINRLFKMGWGNFVIADDIGRVAYFCMKRFKGMCTAVPYAMMYQYLGQSKAYETMEDAKKANSSIFKVRKSFSRVLGEWRTTNKLDKYSQLNEGDKNE